MPAANDTQPAWPERVNSTAPDPPRILHIYCGASAKNPKERSTSDRASEIIAFLERVVAGGGENGGKREERDAYALGEKC